MILVLRKLLENLGLSHLKKNQTAIAVAAVASLLSVSLSSSAIVAPNNQVFERQESSYRIWRCTWKEGYDWNWKLKYSCREVWGIIESSVSSPPSHVHLEQMYGSLKKNYVALNGIHQSICYLVVITTVLTPETLPISQVRRFFSLCFTN
jgi:hypothetical protein